MGTFGGRLGVMAIALLAGGRARAAGEGAPLMVAAEIDAGLGIDAQDVRTAVGAELHARGCLPFGLRHGRVIRREDEHARRHLDGRSQPPGPSRS